MILPSWEEYLEDETKLFPIYIEPKMAFGTGHHPTTCLCLEAVAELWAQKKITPQFKFLDVGTGSGILSIACAKLGLRGHGLDIDQYAIDNAIENIKLNLVEKSVLLSVGSLDSLKRESAYDLIMANILAQPLKYLAKSLADHLKANGFLILSGILNKQEDSLIKIYQKNQLQNLCVLRHGEWSALVWTKK